MQSLEALLLETQPPCPAHQGRFTDQEESTRNTVCGSFHEVVKKGVMKEIQPSTASATQALSCCRGSDAIIRAICQGECRNKNRAQSGGHDLT